MKDRDPIGVRQAGSELRNVLRAIGRHEKAGTPVPINLFERKHELATRLTEQRLKHAPDSK